MATAFSMVSNDLEDIMKTPESAGNKHEQARDIAEEALEKLVQGKDSEADALIEKAKKIDRTGVEELLEDLEEDAEARGELPAKR
jgi:F0F1-type ATP synthase membrane subunit b/b'